MAAVGRKESSAATRAGVVRRLVMPLFEVISVQGYDPLAAPTQ
jgi:hypothetical protein